MAVEDQRLKEGEARVAFVFTKSIYLTFFYPQHSVFPIVTFIGIIVHFVFLLWKNTLIVLFNYSEKLR